VFLEDMIKGFVEKGRWFWCHITCRVRKYLEYNSKD